MPSAHDILRYLADLAPERRVRYDIVHRSDEFVYLGWRPSLMAVGDPLNLVDDRLGRLASIDALHSAERLLRIGWLILCGTIDHHGEPERFCMPLLSAPIRLRRVLRAHHVIHEGDIEMPEALFDEEARGVLEDSTAPYGGGAVGGAELLNRLPEFRSWIDDALARAGLPAAQLVDPFEADPLALRKEPGLWIAPGAAVYTVRDTAAPNVKGSLLGWTSADVAGTAFEALYRGSTSSVPDEIPDGVQTPLPLNARQREALTRARRETITVVSGPPGTGKSHLVAAAAIDEIARGHSVLVASQSTFASDVIADLLERSPGPRYVRFGRSEHRTSAADDLSEGMARPYSGRDLSQIEERLAVAGRRVEALEGMLTSLLAREQAFSEGLQKRNALTMMTAQAPGVLDEGLDLQKAERTLARARQVHGLFAAYRRSRAGRRLRAMVQARSDATLEQISLAVDAAHAEAAVKRGLAEGGLSLDPLWQQLEEAEAAWRVAVGEAVEARRRARHNGRRTSTRAVAALASALRSGRVQRRRILRDLSGDHFLDVLPLWLGTLTEIDDTLPVTPGMFDVVIFDEASQIDQMRAAPALARAKRAIVVGDPRQLRHVSFIADDASKLAAERHGIEGDLARILDVRRNSLFDAAAGAASVTWLDEHFRSVPHIIAFSNRAFYAGKLRYMTQHPATETKDAIRIRHVTGSRDESGVNRSEIAAVLEEVHEAYGSGVTSIGVVTPFRAQADAIEEALLAEFSPEMLERMGLRTGTVHAFQGNERDTVIVSLAVSADGLGQSLRFVEDPNLFNVLVTRARRETVVVASVTAEELPRGLLAEYFRHADNPPLPSQVLSDASGWQAEIVAELSAYSLPVTPNYPVAGWSVDLAVGAGEQAIGVECAVHARGPDAHIERHRALRRARWTLTDSFQSRWLTQPEAAAASLARQVLETREPRSPSPG